MKFLDLGWGDWQFRLGPLNVTKLVSSCTPEKSRGVTVWVGNKFRLVANRESISFKYDASGVNE